MRTITPSLFSANTTLALFFATALAALPSLACAEMLSGRVVHVADGDTVTLLVERQQIRIRLAGIDAPEKAQAFGQRSKEHLASLVAGKDVDADCGKTDRYGRQICKILVGSPGCADGKACQDANLEQLKAGMAWHYKQYAMEQSPADRAAYSAAEENAHAARMGLWAEKLPVPPWEWRHRQ
jgi:endonuclease YncB( thermonuclease family)